VVDYTGASILALDDDELEVRAHRGPIPTDERQRMRFPLRKALVNRRVIQRREPVIIADVRDDSPVAHMFRQTVGDALDTASSHVRSWLGVPLVVKGTTQGMLALTHDQPNYYANRHIKSVQTFANQVAVAIENARLYQAEQDRQRELRVLLDVAATANSSLDLDEMLARTLDLVVDLLGASRAGVLLVDEHTGGLMPHTLRPERAIAPDDLATMVQACSSVIAAPSS
jgi:GAF domain-containing protein